MQREVNSRTGSTGSSLYQSIQKVHPELSEHGFADAVTRSLRAGRFLLLVAGDGIQEDALALGGLLNRSVTSGFSFGMFEVALYRNEGDDLLIQSRPVVRTQLIERTIVVRADGSFGDGEDEDFGTSTEPLAAKSEAANKVHKDAADWWEPVLSAGLEDPEQLPFVYRWPHHVRGALPWPGTWIMAYRSSGPQASIGVHVRGREIPKAELLRALDPHADAILRDLPEGTEYEVGAKLGVDRKYDDFRDDAARRAWLIQTINQFVNALRWRVGRVVTRSVDA